MRTSPQTVSITSSTFPNTNKLTLILCVPMIVRKKVVGEGSTGTKLQEISANRNIMNKIVFLIVISVSQTFCGSSCPDCEDLPCEQTPGAKYKHNQCYGLYVPGFQYICLNRNNIDESVIANTKIYEDKPSNRVNFFEYFPKHKQNDTHIMCGNDGLKKSCRGRTNLKKIVHCKKGESDKFGKQISQREVCVDFHFASANNFTKMWLVKPNCK